MKHKSTDDADALIYNVTITAWIVVLVQWNKLFSGRDRGSQFLLNNRTQTTLYYIGWKVRKR